MLMFYYLGGHQETTDFKIQPKKAEILAFDGESWKEIAKLPGPGREFLFSVQKRNLRRFRTRNPHRFLFLKFFRIFFKVLIEIFELQEWLTTHWKAYFE